MLLTKYFDHASQGNVPPPALMSFQRKFALGTFKDRTQQDAVLMKR